MSLPEGGPSTIEDILKGLIGMDSGDSHQTLTGRDVDMAMPSRANQGAQLAGAAAGMLPLGKLLQALSGGARVAEEARPAINLGDQMLRDHLDGAMSGSRMGEFAPVDHPQSLHPDLDPEEALKMMELTSKKRQP
jgi:hypothetical protein